MNYYGICIPLKVYTTENDVWKCVKNGFLNNVDLDCENPEKLSCITSSISYFWENNAKSRFIKFKFVKKCDDNSITTVKITFDKEEIPDCNVHYLTYEEEYLHSEKDAVFLGWEFFNAIKDFVPKKQIGALQDDSRKCLKHLIDEYKLRQKKLKTQEESDCQEYSFFADVIFNYDSDGKIFFEKNWVEKLSEDLWFAGCFYKVDYGFVKKEFQDYLVKNAPDLKKIKKATNNLYDMVEDKAKDHILEYMGYSFPEKSCIQILYHNQNEEKKIDETDFENGIPDYETFRNFIISKLSYGKAELAKQMELLSPVHFSFMNMEEVVNNEQVDMYLKSKGLDSASIEKLKSENENLSEENLNLKNKNSELSNEKESWEKKAKKLQTELDDKNHHNRENNDNNEEIEKLNKQIIELEEKNKNQQNQISGLNTRNSELEKRLTEKQNENRGDCVSLKIPCSEENLFPDEIEDYFYKVFYEAVENELKNCPTNKEDERIRKRDVLEDILDRKEFDWKKSSTAELLRQIEKILKDSRNPSQQALSQMGFSNFSYAGEHLKCCFHKKRYQVVFAGTPSDKRGNSNKMTEIKGILLLC